MICVTWKCMETELDCHHKSSLYVIVMVPSVLYLSFCCYDTHVPLKKHWTENSVLGCFSYYASVRMRKRGIRYSQGAVTPIGPVQTPATGIDTRDVQVCTETVLRVRTYTNMHGSWLDQNVLKALLISVGRYWKKKKNDYHAQNNHDYHDYHTLYIGK